jgi:hypothetical protein
MVEKSTWSANEQIHTFLQAVALHFSIHASDEQTDSFMVELSDFFGHIKDLKSKLSGWGDNDNASSIYLFKL